MLKQITKIKIIKRPVKILLITLLSLLLVLFIVWVLILQPTIQTRLANQLFNTLNEKYKTIINVGHVDLSDIRKVKIHDILIKDHLGDTTIYVKELHTSIKNIRSIFSETIKFGETTAIDPVVKIVTYKGEIDNTMVLFAGSFDDDNDTIPSDFKLKISNIFLKNGRFYLKDFNKENPEIETYKKINSQVKQLDIFGAEVSLKVRNLSFADHRGLFAERVNTDFTFSKKRSEMTYLNSYVKTKKSEIQGDITMSYDQDGLSDFLNKVVIKTNLIKGYLSQKELKTFYDEIGFTDTYILSSKIKGTLNDFTFHNLNLRSREGIKITGDYHLKNAFNEQNFLLDASINLIKANRQQIINILPNLLKDKLPKELSQLGVITTSGYLKLNHKDLNLLININSDIGFFNTDLKLSNYNDFKNTSYEGSLQLVDVNFGKLLKQNNLGKISSLSDIKGVGLTLESINANINGVVNKLDLNNYTYSGIEVGGNIKDKNFEGLLLVDDPNLKLYFQGLADLTTSNYKLDFKAKVIEATLNKLNWYNTNKTAIVSSNINMDMVGSRLENMTGSIILSDIKYTNNHNTHNIESLTIKSKQLNNIQTVNISSSELIDAFFKGHFRYEDLPKITQNAFGSIYSNYKPFEIERQQFVSFNFKIHNSAIKLFYPNITIDKPIQIKGEINPSRSLLDFKFTTDKVTINNNYFNGIKLIIDNKNPIFNAQLTIDEFKNNDYNIKDFTLINKTLNDTLYCQSKFVGGENAKDQFDISFYHTIDQNEKNIIGLQPSKLFVNNTHWDLKPTKNYANKIIYNPKEEKLRYDNIFMSSGEQHLALNGFQNKKGELSLNIDIERVILSDLLPNLDPFRLDGLINGALWIERKNNTLIPIADVQIIDFTVNDELQGDLVAEIKGADSNKDFDVNFYLEKNAHKTISAIGSFNFKEGEPHTDLSINFDKFSITPLNALGKGVIENIRGSIKGDAKLKGALTNPTLKGELKLYNGGIYFPFTNIDYSIAESSKVELNNRSFILNSVLIHDNMKQTSGYLNGKVTYHQFKKWLLDLDISSNNLFVLNILETPESLFYGKGFLNGAAHFDGNTDNINMSIDGSTNPETKIVITMNNGLDLESSDLLHFKDPKQNETPETKSQIIENFKGLTMKFDLDVNKNALIRFEIDQETGSYIEGKGNGSILMDIDTKSQFNMYGDYAVDKGTYRFKYGGGFINKPFDIKKGSSISFLGDPYKSLLDINAVYHVKADPSVLIPDLPSNKNVLVQLNTKITGELFDSKQEFDIDIPNAGVDLNSEIEFALNKNDTGNLMRQYVSLLTIGGFYNENNFNATTTSLQSEGISSFALLVSNAVMDVFSDPEDKIQLGFDYNQANKNIDNLYTNNQLGVTLTTKFGKNNNFVIDSEVLVSTGYNANSGVAGNVNVKFPSLNKKETLFLNVFNRQNEIQYSEEEEGYTQGLGLSWQINFDTKKEFLEKIGITKSKK